MIRKLLFQLGYIKINNDDTPITLVRQIKNKNKIFTNLSMKYIEVVNFFDKEIVIKLTHDGVGLIIEIGDGRLFIMDEDKS